MTLLISAFISVSLIICMTIILFTAIKSKLALDRIIAINSFGTLTSLLVCSIGYMELNPQWEDIAILYALINCTTTIIFSKLFTNINSKVFNSQYNQHD